MGASSWVYYTPYRDDPEAALQELRRRVFAEIDADPDGPVPLPGARPGGGTDQPTPVVSGSAAVASPRDLSRWFPPPRRGRARGDPPSHGGREYATRARGT